jgi:hypothetical protein
MSGQLKRRILWAVVGVGIIAGAICLYLRKQDKATANLPPESVPIAPVARVERADLSRSVVIPAEFRGYVAVELHAKVSGYLDQMNVDFGDRVKAGQLLITIEVPELQDQLNNAIAEEQRAEANYTNAHLIYARLAGVNRQHPNLVAQQDIDTASAKQIPAFSNSGGTLAWALIVGPIAGLVAVGYVRTVAWADRNKPERWRRLAVPILALGLLGAISEKEPQREGGVEPPQPSL